MALARSQPAFSSPPGLPARRTSGRPYATPWGPGLSRDVQVTGAGGVPADATAVLLNVTVTGTTTPSFLTIWPAGQPAALASSLNWAAGDTIPNAVTAKLSTTGALTVKIDNGTAHVIADTAGRYT